MASHVPYMAFLRPLAPPRAATMQRFLRFSTSSRCRKNIIKEDPNLVASQTADPAYPPRSMRSDPRPKESRGSQRVSHPPKERPYPTRTASHHQPVRESYIPAPVVPLPEHLSAPNLPYFVNRTKSKMLPVYHKLRAGGSRKLTMIQKVDGDKEVLRKELETALELKPGASYVNPVTGHVVLKGLFRYSVRDFLYKRRF